VRTVSRSSWVGTITTAWEKVFSKVSYEC